MSKAVRSKNCVSFALLIIMPSEALTHSLIEAVKANDEKALKTLYNNNYSKVQQYVLQNSGTEEQAKDIYQDAFITTWRNIQLGKFKLVENSSLNAYIFQVAKYKWLDHLRSSSVKKTIRFETAHEDMMTFEDLTDIDTERIALIKQNFKKLGDACRDMLTRFYYRRQALKEIAEALRITEETAKNNKYRCMERLRSMINP
ncbi:MAG: hypothetical protein BGP13_02465 [Sphingobacteriales bacterium 40-81]|nr:MAG: hypothetical protein BGP13_02465 [Sphingobacteriales bacterium 40-81]